MEPIFIYCDKVKFQNNDYKTFKIDFNDGDNLDGVIFRKNRDYYISSMSSFIELEQNLKELKYYNDIKIISELSNEILKKGIEYRYDEKILEVTLENVNEKYELLPEKSNRGLSIKTVEFFDKETKTKRLVYVYSPYEELRLYGLTFENKEKSIYKYTINLKEENNKMYIEKRIFFNKKKAAEEIIKETDRKNVFFMKYKTDGEIYAAKIEFGKLLYERIEKYNNFDMKKHLSNSSTFQLYIYTALFQNGKTFDFLFTNRKDQSRAKYPIIVESNSITIYGGISLYITPELYAKNGSIFKNQSKVADVVVTPDLLTKFRTQLNDPDFTVSKIYGYKGTFYSGLGTFTYSDLVMPEFNSTIKIKKTTPTEANDVFKKTLESNFNLLDNITYSSEETTKLPNYLRIKKIKEEAVNNIENDFEGQYAYLNTLSKKVNLKSLTHAYENFYLYDLENFIKPSFTTELQKEFSIYGLISFSGETKKDNKLKLITPENKLKFEVIKDTYKNSLKFELSKVHTKKTFNVVGDHILNFSMLRTSKQKKIGEKRRTTVEIIDTFKIIGIQNTEYNFLNPIYVSISSDAVIQQLIKFKNYKYRFCLESFMFSSNIENETDVILLVSNGLNNAKKALIKQNIESTLGVCFLTEIKDWDIIKGQSKRTQAVFSDVEDVGQQTAHFAFPFTTKNISDLLNFSVTLVDGSGQNIKFPSDEKKLPIINFKIQIIK